MALLNRGANVNALKRNGWSALHIACQEGHADIVKLLLDSGSEQTPNKDGWFPLHVACRTGYVMCQKKMKPAR